MAFLVNYFIFQYLRQIPAGPAVSTSNDLSWPWSFKEASHLLLAGPLFGRLIVE